MYGKLQCRNRYYADSHADRQLNIHWLDRRRMSRNWNVQRYYELVSIGNGKLRISDPDTDTDTNTNADTDSDSRPCDHKDRW